MIRTEPSGGFGYYVSDEQLAAFARLSPLQRLQWLEDARQFLLLALPPEIRERQERLRRGETILGG
ncbi:MAG: hypothetical protein M0P39_12330 [Rhodocyclaceae bacterium]|nr:hypothetical protein [Rhodocyclaceae bacterium]